WLNQLPASGACPRCGKPLVKGGYIQPVLIAEGCAACGGLWLDRGELRIVARLLGAEMAEPEVPRAPLIEPVAPPPMPPVPGTSQRREEPGTVAPAGPISPLSPNLGG